ncbi:MAG: hypothetical protein NWF04_03015 [Candidatus Bathyarchaeota archaeon]|nr:hypothetical protein [Candidatus Bathyarchaeota archaeon]
MVITQRAIRASVVLAVCIVWGLLLVCLSAQAQNVTSFTPDDQFRIPALNGTISFGSNGSYTSAVLEDDMWVFSGLQFGDSFVDAFRLSVQDCSITVWSYGRFASSGATGILRYTVVGEGSQTFDVGWYTTSRDWSVIVEGEFVPEGKDWTLSEDKQTLTVTTNAQNIALLYITYPPDMQENSSLTTYQKHSVAIAAGITTAIALSIAVAVKEVNKRREAKQ